MTTVKVFHVDAGAAVRHTAEARTEDTRMAAKGDAVLPGWYWWPEPSGDAHGPFSHSEAARADALCAEMA